MNGRIEKHIRNRILWFIAPYLAILFLVFIVIIGIFFQSSQNTCEDNTGGNFNVATSADREAVANSLHDNLKKVSGATEAGIAGYLGNTEHESGFDSGVVQSHLAFDESKAMNGSISGYALGLNQWDNSRRVELLNFAKSQNKDWKDASLQLDFALNHDGTNSDLLKQGLKINSVDEATEFLRAKWERGGVGTQAERQAKAKAWYSKFSGGSSDKATDTIKNAMDNGTNQKQSEQTSSGCKTDLTQGMGSSGAPVTEMPAQYKDKVKNKNFTATSPSNTYPFGQCTWYTYNRMQALGTPVENALGNGGDWGSNAKAKGYQTDTQPHVGWAVSFAHGSFGSDPTYGHIAVVEAMSDDKSHFLISECNVVNGGSGTVSFRELTNGSGMTFIKGK
ncbi:phage tail tip lysozyme [Leuconostoc citreum]|uniref:phage tail tip lysozyme n=1 Tax=Leuconostoc citreum TaxID=33964 RepID=UPI0021A387D0|nr:phage tail tip lysozyme [Leuconostoc citreum]MCT3056218.1 CHAP domain-containing protein [Leuconostoc citreum]MCT3060159.1 CHAP domain-containing protein [Leuconostoc citreum]